MPSPLPALRASRQYALAPGLQYLSDMRRDLTEGRSHHYLTAGQRVVIFFRKPASFLMTIL